MYIDMIHWACTWSRAGARALCNQTPLGKGLSHRRAVTSERGEITTFA